MMKFLSCWISNFFVPLLNLEEVRVVVKVKERSQSKCALLIFFNQLVSLVLFYSIPILWHGIDSSGTTSIFD